MSKLRLTCNIILIIVSFTMLILSFVGVELPKVVSGTAIGIEAIAVIGLIVATVKKK